MSKTEMTAGEVWDSLVEGNDRFISGRPHHPHQTPERRGELVGEQTPHAAILGCSDSRVPAEIVFDCGLGDLFVVRNIGQVVNETVIATMEFAVVALGVPLIVVKAHTSCGAVAATIEQSGSTPPDTTPAIRNALDLIRPAVAEEWLSAPRASHVVDAELIDANSAGRRHVRRMIAELTSRSEVIAEAVDQGKVSIVGCQYDLNHGRTVPVTSVGALNI